MVKNLSRQIYILLATILIVGLSLMNTAYAGEFSVSVNDNEIGYRQKLKLTLKLSDENPVEQPDLSIIQDDFEILSTSNYSSTQIINGSHSVEYKWIYVLKPLKKGKFTLGPFSIKTKSGQKSTEKISVDILDTKIAPDSKVAKNSGINKDNVFVATEVSRNSPYRKEPFIYYLRLYTNVYLINISRAKFEIDGAIVDQIGKPEVIKKTYNGKLYEAIQWKFHVTPLKAGALEIPEIEVTGQLPPPSRRPRLDNLFDSPVGNNFDDYFFDSLAARKSEVFSLYSDKVNLEIQPSIDHSEQWLPAKTIKLFEEWQGDDYIAGKPFSRTISIHASGLLSAQLPDLELESAPGKYKVFSNPAKVKQNIEGDLITSSKIIKFTYIPQESGIIDIPEVELNYWNVDKKEFTSTILPARQINILKAPDEQASNDIAGSSKKSPSLMDSDVDNQNNEQQAGESSAKDISNNAQEDSKYTLQMIIAALSGMLITLVMVLIILSLRSRRKANKGGGDSSQEESHSRAGKSKITLSDIKDAATAGELQKTIQAYAHDHWGLPGNLSVYSILMQLKAKYADFDYSKYQSLSRDLNKSLYAGRDFDIKLLKDISVDFIKHTNSIISRSSNKKANSSKAKKLPKMNPS